MKPRLEPAPYTWEDSDIWAFVGLREPLLMGTLFGLSLLCDRRDAELMLTGQEWPKKSVYLAIRHDRHNGTWAETIDLRQGSDRL